MLEVKDKIKETAIHLFQRYGIRSVSMDDIARELSISKKTIYQFYKDKDQIVTLGVVEHIEKERDEFQCLLNSSENAIDEMLKFSTCLKRNLGEINPALLFDLQKFHFSAWELWVDFKNGFIKKTVLNVIKRGKEEGLFRPEINEEILACYRIEAIEMAFNQHVFPSEKFDFVELQITLMDHFLRGMLTMKGLLYYDELNNSTTDENR
ncbi:TetR/AcrR family transcriptional regulator [Reichenbachiella agarivorans]|uniref:TetR/AcrR family transcriptional regulator n=1 Tax=Reichenbachiella agarivorans TaxID=2979464 RepID=A0ABY6CL16_9BACT|nr:TetR/AcrR family transcriptional regulator [Reichenbachiella agarivorans]UXP31182.1 TetR/AcrR family transcriptional regulator [Reichenbachiella agarivorans]